MSPHKDIKYPPLTPSQRQVNDISIQTIFLLKVHIVQLANYTTVFKLTQLCFFISELQMTILYKMTRSRRQNKGNMGKALMLFLSNHLRPER